MDHQIVVVPSDHESEFIEQCMHDLKIHLFAVDLAGVTDRDELIAAFYKAIKAPKGSQLNWDALTDVLHGDILERISSVNHDGMAIRIVGGDRLLILDNQVGDILLRILARTCSYYKVHDLSCFVGIIAAKENTAAILSRVPSAIEEEETYRRMKQEGDRAKARLRME